MTSVDYNQLLPAARLAELEKEPAYFNILIKGFKTAGVAVGVWFWGYIGLSVAWLFVGLFFHIVSEEFRKQKDAKRAFTRQAMMSEKEAILSRVDQRQSWIYFPDIEKAEWLNKMLKQMWPAIAEFSKNIMKTNIEASIQASFPSNISFKFENIDLGDLPPRIDGIKVYIDANIDDEIVCDIDVKYAGDANIKVNVKGIVSGIKQLQLSGTMRVIMKPLVSDVPIIGGMSVFFLKKPKLNFEMSAAANILDVPVLKDQIIGVVHSVIASFLVLPRRLPIRLSDSVNVLDIKYPPPQGVVIIHMVEAKDLKCADTNLITGGKSDPYCRILVSCQEMETKVINSTLNPNWDQYFEAIVDQKHGQTIDVYVFDKDMGSDRGDHLGSTHIEIERIVKEKNIDLWLPLQNVATGKLHIRALWMNTSSNLEDLNRRHKSLTGGVSDTFANAVLIAIVDNAKSLPYGKSGKKRSSYVKMSLNKAVKQTTIKQLNNDPQWDENFEFFVHNPDSQALDIKVWHSGNAEHVLASVCLPINAVLMAQNMTLCKKFPLEECGQDSSLSMRFMLRILVADNVAEWTELSGSSLLSDALKSSFKMVDVGGNRQSSSSNEMGMFGMGSTLTESISEEVFPDTKKAENQAKFASENSFKEKTPPTLPLNTGVKKEPILPLELLKPTPVAPVVSVTPKLSETVQPAIPELPLKAYKPQSKFGQVQMTIRYSASKLILIVVVHQCKNLIPCDKDNLADPYIRLYLLPDRSAETKKRTKLTKNTLNPTFDETFEWPLGQMEIPFRSIDVAVKNDVGLFSKSRTEMGSAVVELGKLGDIGKAVTLWFDLSETK